MKQLLLRVPEDVHARLAARAAKEGRSINSVATEMLDTAIDVVPTNPQTVVRARAAAAGLLRSSGVEVLDAPNIAMVRDTLRGVTLSAQDLIDEQRGPK
jgi:plasmid stability protein